jgi:hypothetical protein
MIVGVMTAPIFTVTSALGVPRRFGQAAPTQPRSFDIMPDGRIVGVVVEGQGQSELPAQIQDQQIHVVLNWFEELKAKVPTK